MLMVQMQKKSIIYLFSFRVQLCGAEKETLTADEANPPLIIDLDVAWVSFSMQAVEFRLQDEQE